MEWLWGLVGITAIAIPFLIVMRVLSKGERNEGADHGGGLDNAPREVL
jgi:hypothetical protein